MKGSTVSTNKRFLSNRQVHRLRKTCDTNLPGGKRDLAILDSMLYQGMRLSEVANMETTQIRFSKDNFFVYLKRRPKPVKAHPNWLQSVNSWMEQRGISLEDHNGPVFVQLTKFIESASKPISKRTISSMVARYGYLAGIAPMKGATRLFPLDLRRTCGRNAFDSGANLLSIAAFLGFNHLESAARFIDVLDLADPDRAVDRIQFS